MRYFLILIFILVLSALYVVLKEKTSEEYVSPRIFDSADRSLPSEKIPEKDLKRKRVVIFDISDLNPESIRDTLATPFLNKIAQSSEVCYSTVNLSPERESSMKSFFECLPPYKIFSNPGRYAEIKEKISSKLRNSSMISEFQNAGYTTRGFFTDTLLCAEFGKYFVSSAYFLSKEELTEALHSSIFKDISSDLIYYADLGSQDDERYYLKKADDLIGKLVQKLREGHNIELRVVLTSTKTSKYLGKYITVFHGFGRSAGFDEDVAVTDMSRKLMKLSGIKPRNYFGGLDLESDEGESGRDHFAGMCGDTLLLFSDEFIYKKLSYSPEYRLFERSTGKDITGKNIGINEKYEDMIPQYFGGDYIKYIVLRNNSENKRTFRMEIRSRRRFEEPDILENYYVQKAKNNRYSKIITRELEPGETDTVRLYYAALYQDFQFTFNDKYKVSYGAAGVNAGTVKNFDENSYYGMIYNETKPEMSSDPDIRLFNRRINY